MKDIVHKKCGKLAFTYSGPVSGIIYAEDATYPDGTKPQPYSPLICGSCKSELQPPFLENLSIEEHMDA